MLSPRTVLNGGERGQEHVRETKKQRRQLKIRELAGEKQRVILGGGGLQARANLNGGELAEEPLLRGAKGQVDVKWI